jgi:hypothetical protein
MRGSHRLPALAVNDGTGRTTTDWTAISNGWHAAVIDWPAASAPDA